MNYETGEFFKLIDLSYTFVYNNVSIQMYTIGGSYMKNESHRGRRGGRCEEGNDSRRGAKTFRRGRALAFYEMMNTKSTSLKKQLETPELQSINPVLVGELKAVEMLMDEFAQLFELVEVEESQASESGIESQDLKQNSNIQI